MTGSVTRQREWVTMKGPAARANWIAVYNFEEGTLNRRKRSMDESGGSSQ
jgi:hypothetical protein